MNHFIHTQAHEQRIYKRVRCEDTVRTRTIHVTITDEYVVQLKETPTHPTHTQYILYNIYYKVDANTQLWAGTPAPLHEIYTH